MTSIKVPFVVLVLLLGLAAPAHAFDCGFGTSDKWLLGAYAVALAGDYTTTKKAIAKGHDEWNPLLSAKPSTEELLAAHLAAGAAVTAAACWLDPGWKRTTWLSLALSVEAYAVHNNLRIIANTKW